MRSPVGPTAAEPLSGMALVTGAASGIGEQLARRLTATSRLVLLDRDAPRLAALCADLGPTAQPVVVDLSDRTTLAQVGLDLAAALPRLDLLVLNAGVGLVGRLADVDDADLDHLLDVNLRAPMVVTRALLPALVAARGRVVVMASLSGVVGAAGQVGYAATKYGLRGFAEALQAELAGQGVSVTTVIAGGVRTRMADNVRRGARVTDAAMAHNRWLADALLTKDPGVVADRVLRAAVARRRRVLVGADARTVDLVARLSPALAGAVAVRLAARTAPVG